MLESERGRDLLPQDCSSSASADKRDEKRFMRTASLFARPASDVLEPWRRHSRGPVGQGEAGCVGPMGLCR